MYTNIYVHPAMHLFVAPPLCATKYFFTNSKNTAQNLNDQTTLESHICSDSLHTHSLTHTYNAQLDSSLQQHHLNNFYIYFFSLCFLLLAFCWTTFISILFTFHYRSYVYFLALRVIQDFICISLFDFLFVFFFYLCIYTYIYMYMWCRWLCVIFLYTFLPLSLSLSSTPLLSFLQYFVCNKKLHCNDNNG